MVVLGFVAVCWFGAFLSRLVDFVVAVCLWWVWVCCCLLAACCFDGCWRFEFVFLWWFYRGFGLVFSVGALCLFAGWYVLQFLVWVCCWFTLDGCFSCGFVLLMVAFVVALWALRLVGLCGLVLCMWFRFLMGLGGAPLFVFGSFGFALLLACDWCF